MNNQHRLLMYFLACFVLLHPAKSFAQTWREIQSPHFRVVTDGSEQDGRNVAKEFEQMHSVFALRFHNAAFSAGAPLLIVAVRDPGLHALAPALWKERERVVGQFFKHWEQQYALVRLDTFGDLNQAVVFHEYTHSVYHANFHWLPTWLDEGMAEFYAYTRFQGDHIYMGAPSVRLQHLQNETIFSIPEMLTATSQTYFKDQRKDDLFYGEAWAMVHYMTFGPDMEGGHKLTSFIALLEKGTPQAEAFQQIFGDPKVFEQKLSVYRSHFALTAFLLPPGEPINTKAFSAKVLTAAEANYELGSFDIGVYDSVEGKKRLLAAESADPAMAGPHEELGFLAWKQGKDEEARTEWQKAIAADSSRYRASFALLMSQTTLKEQNPQQLEQTQHALEAITEKAPTFAPAFVELALIQWRLGHMNQAYKSAQTAEKLEPWRAGYHLLVGYILLNGHQPKLVADYARIVAARWPGTDHDEAVDLWNLLPTDMRGDGPALTLAVPSDGTVVRGTILSSSCEKEGFNLVLQPKEPNAPALKLLATGPFENGFSDTLWAGADHFTPCYHLTGLPAIVTYKNAGEETKKLLVLGTRDDLPEYNPPTPTTEAATPVPSHP